MTKKNTPVVLCILDGWGCRGDTSYNAIAEAYTPQWDAIIQQYPMSQLGTSGLDVGLPDGQMGNSEVGHMNIGGGRVTMQNLPKIDQAIADGSLAKNPVLVQLINTLTPNGKACHIMGLISDGGVHAHMDHVVTLARYVSEAGIQVYIHAFLDGRDTPPESGEGYIQALMQSISSLDRVDVATMSGRYYAMDRDKRWERVGAAYQAIVNAKGDAVASSPVELMQESYRQGVTDEFIRPTVIEGYPGMQEGDGFIMANFRSDRARQLLQALVDPEFDGFERKAIGFSAKVGMVEYSDRLTPLLATLFPAEKLTATLGEVVSKAGLKQLRIAETEKYAHVTFFFNGGVESVFEGEDRILVPSPDVATYDLQPHMSAPEVTEELVQAIHSGDYGLIVVNYANTDMVGHTGNMKAAVAAVEAVDKCLGALRQAVEEEGAVMLITADHGNAEMMVDSESGEPHTAHTLNPVPFVVIGTQHAGIEAEIALQSGKLCDIAPTILRLMQIPQPVEMTGRSLL